MILSPCFRASFNEDDKQVCHNQISFQYDWDNDAECDIREELLTEITSPKASKSVPICSMKVHASPFDLKISKKIAKSPLCKSMDAKCKRADRDAITLVNSKKEYNITEYSANDVSKSTDLDQTNPIKYCSKFTNMREEINGLLKLLVIERKKQEDLECTVKAASQCNKNDFITMKDVQCVENSDQ